MRCKTAAIAVTLMAAASWCDLALAQELPSSLQVVGAVTSANGPTASLVGSQVLVIDKGTGNRVGSGAILDSQGTFVIDMLQSVAFNGRVMLLKMAYVGKIYDLKDGGSAAEFPYSGSFPFPTRMTKAMTVSLTIPAAASADSTASDKFDTNGDGVLDEKDIESMRAALAHGVSNAKFDVNGDGVFNSLDIVEGMRDLARRRAH